MEKNSNTRGIFVVILSSSSLDKQIHTDKDREREREKRKRQYEWARIEYRA